MVHIVCSFVENELSAQNSVDYSRLISSQHNLGDPYHHFKMESRLFTLVMNKDVHTIELQLQSYEENDYE